MKRRSPGKPGLGVKAHRPKAKAAGCNAKTHGPGAKAAGRGRKGKAGGGAIRWRKRRWTKRAVPVRTAVVTKEGVRAIVKAFRQWLWEAYRGRGLSLEDVAAEIGATRQGFTKLLVRQRARMFFHTFVQACFLRRESETGFAVEADGWRFELRWSVQRCNRGCVSFVPGRA